MYNTVSVRSQDIVVPGVMTLTVLAPEMAAASAPGQFYMLKSWREQDPFLMRPISIDHIDVQAGTLTFLYKVVGYRHCAAAPAGGAAPCPRHGGLCLSQRQE